MSFPPARLPFADGVIGVGSAVAIVPWLRVCEYVCADFVSEKGFFSFFFFPCNEVIIVVVRAQNGVYINYKLVARSVRIRTGRLAFVLKQARICFQSSPSHQFWLSFQNKKEKKKTQVSILLRYVDGNWRFSVWQRRAVGVTSVRDAYWWRAS